MTTVDDRAVGGVIGIDVCIADEKARDFVDWTLRGGETDADKFRISDFGFRIANFVLLELSVVLPNKFLQPFDGKREMRTALVAYHRMNLINDAPSVTA